MDEPARVTSALLWRGAMIAALIDAPLLWLVHRLVGPEVFAAVKWRLAAAAAAVFATLWAVFGAVLYWDEVYHAVFPAWSRWLLPPGFGLLFGALAVAFWCLARRVTPWQSVAFVILGGLVSLVGHTIGIWRGLLDVPMLAQASAASALVFGVFEFTFYWCVIVALAAAGRAHAP